MKKKYYLRHIITAGLVIAWLVLAFINRNIITEAVRKYFDREYTFEQTRDAIIKDYTDKLEGKYAFINLNGLYVRASGGRNCNDVIKLKNGSLTSVSEFHDTTNNARKTIELNNALKEKGIDFLYVQSPFKTNADLLPYGLTDEMDRSIDTFLTEIDGKVPYIDLRTYMTDTAEHIDQYFYKTDHHWNPIGAFKGFQLISEYLQKEYPDEAVNGDYQNIDNWEINRKENWFLGSRGKRTGVYFGGVDDLIWLTPKFETEISCANVYRNEFYYGDYSEANIREEYINEKDYFMLNAYCVYIGGNYPLVQHRNTKAPVDRKLLIIEDSFVLPLQTYFSTVFREVDVIDLRHYKAGTLYEYIEESDPDLVIMMYNGSMVVKDDVFETGDPDEKGDRADRIIYQKSEIRIEADDKKAWRYVPVCDTAEAGKRYTLLCDSINLEQGDADGISIKLYDKTNKKTYDSAMWDLKYCEQSGSYEWTFTAPADVSDLEIIVYSGIAGQTNGNSILLKNVRLLLNE